MNSILPSRAATCSHRLTKALLPLALAAAAALANPALSAAACSQSGHAWFDYTQSGATSVNRGGSIWLAAAGVVGQVTFKFYGPSGAAFSYTTGSANSNCVVNQILFGVNFIPDTYTVAATFQDGNTGRLVIDSFAGTLVVTEPATPPAGSASCGQPAHVFYTSNTVPTGGLLTFGGVTFPSTFSQVRIKDAVTKNLVMSFYLPPAGSNCVENQRTMTISLSPGNYIVRADFIDEFNVLHNDKIGDLTVTP